MERKDRFVDELLESALHHRREAEPRSGLEGRILESVHAAASEHRSRKGLWFAFTGAAVAAAICIAVLVTNRPRTPTVQTPQASQAVSAQPQHQELAARPEAIPRPNRAATVLGAKQTARKAPRRTRQAEAHHWPAQFPTPAPLTNEEKALIRYVQETPPKVLAEPIFKGKPTIQQVEIKPVEIPPVVIKPVEFGSAGAEMQ